MCLGDVRDSVMSEGLCCKKKLFVWLTRYIPSRRRSRPLLVASRQQQQPPVAGQCVAMLVALVCVVAAPRTGSPKTKGENAEVSLAGDGGRPPSLHLKAYQGECGALATELKRTQAVGVNQPDQKGISALQVRATRPAGATCNVCIYRSVGTTTIV